MILLPTLNRPLLLKRFLQSYIETKASVPGLILVDEADLIANESSYQAIMAELPDGWRIKNTGKAISMGDKTRFIWPYVKEQNVNWIGLLNDDHYCATMEWDKKAEALLDGTNMVSCNDGSWNFGFNVVGLTAWSMPLLDACGFPIFPRNLQHYFIDNIWKAIGESSGCWLETIKINIEHRHAFRGMMEPDDTFRRVNAPDNVRYDQKEFQHFMEQDFKSVIDRILDLRRTHQVSEKFV